MLPLLAPRLRAIAMDTIGFGESTQPPWPPSIAGYAPRRRRRARRARAQARLAGRTPHRRRDRGRGRGSLPRARRAGSFSPPRPTPTRSTVAAEQRDHCRRWTSRSRATDGSHLVALWQSRAAFYPPGRPELLERCVLDGLRAGPSREAGHRAVHEYRMEERLRSVRAPVLLVGATENRTPLRSSLRSPLSFRTPWSPRSTAASFRCRTARRPSSWRRSSLSSRIKSERSRSAPLTRASLFASWDSRRPASASSRAPVRAAAGRRGRLAVAGAAGSCSCASTTAPRRSRRSVRPALLLDVLAGDERDLAHTFARRSPRRRSSAGSRTRSSTASPCSTASSRRFCEREEELPGAPRDRDPQPLGGTVTTPLAADLLPRRLSRGLTNSSDPAYRFRAATADPRGRAPIHSSHSA